MRISFDKNVSYFRFCLHLTYVLYKLGMMIVFDSAANIANGSINGMSISRTIM